MLLSVQDIHQRLLVGQGPKSLPELVIALSKRLTGRIADFVDKVDEEITDMEEQVDNAPRPEHRQQVSEVKREIIALRRYLLPMSEAFTDLEESDLGFLDERLKMLLIETDGCKYTPIRRVLGLLRGTVNPYTLQSSNGKLCWIGF